MQVILESCRVSVGIIEGNVSEWTEKLLMRGMRVLRGGCGYYLGPFSLCWFGKVCSVYARARNGKEEVG